MIEITGKINGLSVDFVSGSTVLSLTVNETDTAKTLVDELGQAEKITVKIGKYRKKRSLDANGYFWLLVDKLAEKTGVPKKKIYREYIRNIGGNSDTVCVKDEAVNKLCEVWEHNGLGWLCDISPSKIQDCLNVTLYYGSSTYDTAQMSRLIDQVVQDCEEQGIPTATPDDIANMLSLWGTER